MTLAQTEDAASTGKRRSYWKLLPLVCAIAVWGMGILVGNVLPIVIELLRQHRGLDPNQLGTISFAYVVGNGLTTVTSPLWVRRVSARWLSLAALLILAAAMVFVGVATTILALASGWVVIGCCTSLAAMPSFAILGDSENPTRTYSVALFSTTAFAALVSLALPHFGIVAALSVLSVLYLLATPFALGLGSTRLAQPERIEEGVGQVSRGSRAGLAAPVVAMIAGAVYLGISWGGIWNFVGVIGESNGIDVKGAGLVVALGLTGSLVGSLLPALVGNRVRPMIMLSVAMIGVVLTYPAMLSHSQATFFAGFAVHGALSTGAFAYLLGVVRGLDVTDRVYVAFPAIRELGGAFGAKFTGWFLKRSAPQGFFELAAAVVITSWMILLIATRLRATDGRFDASPTETQTVRDPALQK